MISFEKEVEIIRSKLQLRKKQSLEKARDIDLILCEIDKMLNSLYTSVDFFPIYPRIIVDSWDFNDELGKELLVMYQNYIKILKRGR